MSELRKDPSSGDWVIIAPGRAKRPDMFATKRTPRTPAPKSTCPFENLKGTGNTFVASYPNEGEWKIAVILNKYPALVHMEGCAVHLPQRFYEAMTGVGEHELIITRDHNKDFAALPPAFAAKVFKVFQERHRAAARDSCLIYSTTFFNWGPSVGGSVWHPHYQFMGLPFIPPHAVHSLRGSEAYFKKHHRCVRCDIIREEQKNRTRIVAENKFAIAFTPYASKRPFEIAIFPKAHGPHFMDSSPAAMAGIASILQSVLQRLKKYVNDPDLNFFIHEAPTDGKQYGHHHWHIEVMPNISRLGGLEFSTSIYINIVDPDAAAAILRGEKIKG